jgi:hypothetical protein
MHMLNGKRIPRIVLAVVLAGVASGAFAQEQNQTGAGTVSDATVRIKQMAQYLAGAQKLQVRIMSGYDVVQSTGEKIQFMEARQVALVRPNKMRIDVERDDGKKSLIIFNGNDISTYDFSRKVMASASRPGDIDGALKYFVRDLQMRIPLAMLFTADLPAELNESIKSAEVVQKVTLFDTPCLQIAVREKNVDFQVWIPETGAPLPRRIVITYKRDKEKPQYWADFSNWNLSPDTPESFFNFEPPEGTQRIPFLVEIYKVSGVPAAKGGPK